jgi:putative ABC transport system permease protein
MAGIGLTVFGAMAVALSALGLFGLVAYSVKQSTREIGIRMALGASRASVVGRFLGSGFRLASVGAAAGIAIAAGTSRLMSSLLYEVGALDAVAFVGVSAIVLGIAVAASCAAAWRAARVHPLSALRHQ